MPTSHTRQHVESTENRSRDSRARDSTLSPSEAVSQHAKSTIVTPPPRVDLIICGKEDVVNTYMYWKIAHHKESLTTKKKRGKKVQSWENLNVKFLIRYKLVFFLRKIKLRKRCMVHTCRGHYREIIPASRLRNSFADHLTADDTRSRSGLEVSYPQLTEFVGSHCY